MRHLDLSRPWGAARLHKIPTGWSVALDGDPNLAEATEGLAAAVDAVHGLGGGLVRHWATGGNQLAAEAATQAGMTPERELLQLRRPLPVEEPSVLPVRAFVVGQDEDAWLEVNNRAFDWHPEQGGWTRADLDERMAAPWFDPAGFLLHEEEGKLVGFCWTKEHRDVQPNLGEIFVIAVDPASGRKGLGRPLTLAGLDHLHRSGLTVGMLYVEATNDAGRRLYDGLGFTVHHVDRSFVTQVAAG